ncbi:Lipase_GDSL domain-containing protein, partial [Cephalotus follicularis]
SFSKVFAFGGSFTDTGNAHLVGGLSPFVGTLVSHSSHGSPYKTTGQRLSNGRLVVDYMCESLGVPYLPPYKDTSLDFSQGVNFAIAGSTALSSDYFSNHNIGHSLMWGSNPLSYQTQIDWFNKYLLEVDCKGKSDTDCRVCLEDTLFWIGEMGTNDYARIYGVNNVPVKWVTEQAVGHVCRLMKTLLERGAKYIVVQGLPPTGCSPLQMLLSTEKDRENMGCAASGNEMTKAHNVLLQQRLEEYRKQYPQCTIVYADYWNAFRQIFTNYKKYQFEEPCKACCGAGGGPLNFILNSLCGDHGTSTCKNPDQYISWDGVHFTEAMHQHVADLFLNRGYCQP